MADRLENTISQMRRALAKAIRARIGWQLAAAAGVLIWIGLLLDKWFEPTSQERSTAFIALFFAAILWLFIRCLPLMIYRPSRQELVGVIAKARPEFADSLIAASEMITQTSDALPELQKQQTHEFNRTNRERVNQTLREFEPKSTFRKPQSSWVARLAKLAWASAFLYGLISPSNATLYLKRLALSNEPWPRAVRLVPEGFHLDEDSNLWTKHFARGTSIDLLVWADLLRDVPAPETIRVKSSEFFNRKLPDSMLRVGNPTFRQEKEQSSNLVVEDKASNRSQKYRLRLEELHQSLTLRLRGGDDQISIQLVASERPKVESARLIVNPPAYLGLPAEEYAASELRALYEGSSFELLLSTNKPIQQAQANWLTSSEKNKSQLLSLSMSPSDWSSKPTAFVIKSSDLRTGGSLSLQLTDTHRIKGSPNYLLPIDVVQDEPPTVSTNFEGIGKLVTRNALLKVVVNAKDDYRLNAVTLVLENDDLDPTGGDSQNDKRTRKIVDRKEIDIPKEMNRVLSALEKIDLDSVTEPDNESSEPLVAIGERLRLYATAKDAYNLTQRIITRSEIRYLQVVSQEEFLNHLNERERELRKTLEGVLTDARRLAYSIERSADQTETLNLVGEWSLETNKIIRDLEGLVARVRDIRSEAINNRTEQQAFIERLADKVISPLDQLLEDELSAINFELNRSLQAEKSVQAITDLAKRSGNSVQVIETVIEAMQANESYNEVVATLRRLLRDQKQLNKQTVKKQREEALRDLLD